MYEEEFLKYEKSLDEAEKPLVAALHYAGFEVASVWDFVNGPAYLEAIPILLEHLERDYPPRIMEGIVRSLMVKGAPPVVLDTLIEKFKHLINNDSSYKDSVALAIGYLAKKSDFNRVAELVRDRSHGETRFFLIRSLPRIDKKQAGDVLLEILGQPGILATTIAALSILRDARAKPFILPLANGCKPSSSEERRIQQLAKKYLSRLA